MAILQRDRIAQGMGLTQREVGSWYLQQYNHMFGGARP